MSADEFRKMLETQLGRTFKEDRVPRKVINDYALNMAVKLKDFLPAQFDSVDMIDLATAIIMVANEVVNENVFDVEALNESPDSVKFGLN